MSSYASNLRALSGLPSLGAPRLLLILLLVLALALTDSGCARHGLGAQVAAVALLGGRVDDGLVQLAGWGRGVEGRGLLGLGWARGLLGEFGREGYGVGVGVDSDGLQRVSCELLGWGGEALYGIECVPGRCSSRRTCGCACW